MEISLASSLLYIKLVNTKKMSVEARSATEIPILFFIHHLINAGIVAREAAISAESTLRVFGPKSPVASRSCAL